MPLPHRSIADRAARHFPSQACVAGFKLLHDGHVTVDRVVGSSVEATVRGKRARSVRIRADDTTLWVACTCWPSSIDACACKHVWASLLAVDRGGTVTTAGSGPLTLASLAEAGVTASATSAEPKGRREPPPSAKRRGAAKATASTKATANARTKTKTKANAKTNTKTPEPARRRARVS